LSWTVLKFGGTSVSSRERWNTIADRVRHEQAAGLRPVVVCSAIAGVTNLLESLPEAARAGTDDELMKELRSKHSALAAELELELGELVVSMLDEIGRIAKGIALIDEASPRTRARLLANGELLSTLIGARFLQTQGVDIGWLDAREAMVAWTRKASSARPAEGDETLGDEPQRGVRWFLSAEVSNTADESLQDRLAERPEKALITQGFIAGAEGETVVLGRGGSDTSAAILAAKLQAVRCEIWTDVPGMFTADPRLIPSARLLRRLDYDEAQEIASTGAKVLHPRSIAPLRRHKIPMVIRCAPNPAMESTTIEALPNRGAPQVKALSSKGNVTVVSMDTVGMWQQVGFLADVFAVFKAHDVGVDLVSTSESSVTVTLDPGTNELGDGVLEHLAQDLEPYCRVTITRDVAAISIVGIGIRSILHRLGPSFEQFEEQPVHLVTQAASDLNLTFVIDSDRKERMLQRLHSELFQGVKENETFGPSWRELFAPIAGTAKAHRRRWWELKRDELLVIADQQTPAYVYDAPTIRGRAASLKGIGAVDRVFYAMKANSHPEVLDIVSASGLGFECVSPNELELAKGCLGPDLFANNLLFTPNFAPRADYERAYEEGAFVTIDNLHPIERWPEVFHNRELLVRVDVGVGRGHHKHVKTAGAKSKFGLDPTQLPELKRLADKAGARIVGLHAHSGSGISTPGAWRDIATRLAEYADGMKDVRLLDVGGGLGVPEKPGQTGLDLVAVDAALREVREAFPISEMWIEPGRFVVAESGVLLARVTQIKRKRDVTWVGVDAGMHSLMRPALYGAWHEIVNLSRLGERATESVHVVGPICESADVLGRGRMLPPTDEGDVLLIAVAGAYGRTMASEYNMRGIPREVVLDA
jgi:diaminopimelate decarboxylase/aspartate kinase